jgi:hypothetical protein
MPTRRMMRIYALVLSAALLSLLVGYLLRGGIGAREGVVLLLVTALALRIAGRRT